MPYQSSAQPYLDPVIEEYTTGEYYREVFRAKEEYFEKSGVIYEDDPDYDQRMSTFMDWYLFDRDLPGVDLSPIKLFFRKNKEKLDANRFQIYQDFCETIHSIFRMRGKAFFGDDLKLFDLFSKKSYTVAEPDLHQGFAKNDLFEARLIPFQNRYEFSRGFCFHPREMETFILGEIKKVRNQEKGRQTKLIIQLSAMKLKHMRYPHIGVNHIYSFNSKF